MATDIGKAYVQIVPSAQGISGKISSILSPEAKSAGTSAGGVLGSQLVGKLKQVIVAAGIGKAIASSVKEGAALEQSIGGVETLFKNSASKVVANARQAYKTAGVSANEYMEGVTSFAASLLQSTNGNVEEAANAADMAFRDMSDNANKMGSNMQDIQNAYQGFAKQNYTMLDNLKLGYGGTKSEMERLLADAEKLTGVKYDINNLKDVYDAIHVIQDELGITGTTAKEAAETVSGSFNSLKASFKDLLGSIAIGENVKQSFQNLAETLSTFVFDNLIPMLMNIFKNIPEGLAGFADTMMPILMEKGTALIGQLGQGIIQGIPIVLEKLGEITQGFANWVQTSLPTLLEHGVTFLSNFGKGFIQALPDIIRSLGQIISGIVSAIINGMPQILEAGGKLILELGKALITNAPQILAAMVEVVGQLIAAFAGKLPDFLQKGAEVISNIVSGIESVKDTVFQAITNVVTTIVSKISEKAGDFLEKGKELIAKIIEGFGAKKDEVLTKINEILTSVITKIKEFPSKFLEAAKELIAKVVEGFKAKKYEVVNKGKEIITSAKEAIANFKDQFFNIGSNLITGIAQGISHAAGAVRDAVFGAINNAISWVKSKFGIHSPSKVMADEVGKWIPAGMAVGITGNTGVVEDAMDQLTKISTGEMVGSINYQAKSFAKTTEENNKKAGALSEINLSIGGQSFKAFVDSISLEQNKVIDLELAY